MISFSFLLALAIACTKSAESTEPVVPETSTAGVNKTLMLQLVNDARKKGCQCGDTYYPPAPAISWNDQLEKAALTHSRDMAQNNYFSHTSPNGDKAGQRISQAGYRWLAYGENIAMGYNTEKEVVAGWIKSPGHCKNIMNKNYKEMGVAKAGTYWTQAFGSKQ
jgi:uncharacterized protein YkwD